MNLFRGVKKTIVYRGKIKMILDISDWNQQRLFFTRDVEEKEIRFVEHRLQKGDVFIDLGANVGLFSLVASQITGEKGLVYAFEPWPDSYESLCRNVSLNNIHNIVIEQIAATDKEGTIELRLDESEQNKGMATSYTNTFTATRFVRALPLDTYFDNKQLSSLRLIKIDIEGGEYPALKGMQNILKKIKPMILVEIHPEIIQQTPYRQTDIENFLSGLGYKKYFLDKNGNQISERLEKDSSNNYLFV